MSIAVLGAGAFGTALAISLAGKGAVTLWARDAQGMGQSRENTARLPGCPLSEGLFVTEDLAEAAKAQTLLAAVPMQKLRGFLRDNAAALDGKTIVACCKGIELNTGLGPVAVIREVLPHATAAILTGPSFAADIARGLPTALTLACADKTTCATLQQSLTTANLRLYRTSDTVGAELGGALKTLWPSLAVPQSGPVWRKRPRRRDDPWLRRNAAACRASPRGSGDLGRPVRFWRSDADLHLDPIAELPAGAGPRPGGAL